MSSVLTSGVQSPTGTLEEYPTVTIVMPVFNEAGFIERSLMGALGQDYPSGRLEIIVADGMSTDGTREKVMDMQSRFENVRLIDNPYRIVPTGLNRAIAAARSEIIVRFDGHCEYPHDYVRKLIEMRRKFSATSIGGVLAPQGKTYVQKAIAAAYYSPVGLGGSALKAASGEMCREVDAVHGGCWERKHLLEIGGFDESMVRNQDDELSFRLRKRGGRVVQNLALSVSYHVRGSFKKLFFQFAQYGFWKVHVIRKHPRQASIRHVVPTVFVSLLLFAAIFSAIVTPAKYLLFGLLGAYLVTLMLSSIVQTWGSSKALWPGIVMALAAMHIGYGIGFASGLVETCLGFTFGSLFQKATR